MYILVTLDARLRVWASDEYRPEVSPHDMAIPVDLINPIAVRDDAAVVGEADWAGAANDAAAAAAVAAAAVVAGPRCSTHVAVRTMTPFWRIARDDDGAAHPSFSRNTLLFSDFIFECRIVTTRRRACGVGYFYPRRATAVAVVVAGTIASA